MPANRSANGEHIGVLLNGEALYTHAREIAAQTEEIANAKTSLQSVRLSDDRRLLASAFRTAQRMRAQGEELGALEWIADNFYILEQNIESAEQAGREFFAKMPHIRDAAGQPVARAYYLALEIVRNSGGKISDDAILGFFDSFQKEKHLTLRELWALPELIKIALIKQCSAVARRLLNDWWKKHVATKLIDSAEKLTSVQLARQLVQIGKTGVLYSPGFATAIEKDSRGAAPAAELASMYERMLARRGLTVEELVAEGHREQARWYVQLSNCISSLRLLSVMDWSAVLGKLNVVHKLLCDDEVYPEMDEPTRMHYCKRVQEIAEETDSTEPIVAEAALELTRSGKGGVYAHVGYYLFDRGQNELYKQLGVRRKIRKRSVACYIGAILLPSALAAALIGSYAYSASGSAALFFVAAAIALIPAWSVMARIVDAIAAKVVSPSITHRLSLENGLGVENRTLIALPTLLTNATQAREMAERMEVLYLSNREENLFFALLGDYGDSAEETAPEDEAISRAALETVRRLNEKYGERFYYFHRKRTFIKSEGKYMGYERKRGALMQLNRLLRGEGSSAFEVISSKPPEKVRFVITLDADTQMPLGATKKIIGAAAHPLNAPVLGLDGRTVERGYGVLQPIITTSAESAAKSAFARLYAGQAGLDPYSFAVSNIYQDMFGEGIFTGKGVYEIDAFTAAVEDSIPDSTVLSHDLLEGSFARTALLNDVYFVDGFPASYASWAKRLHRWTRGDWQLLPYLGRYVRDNNGIKRRNRLGALSKWKIIDNLRRSLTAPFSLLLVFGAFSFLPGAAWPYILLYLAELLISLLIDLAGKLSNIGERSFRPKLLNRLKDLKGSFVVCLLRLFFLAYEAYLMADAIIRTLWRLIVSRKRMLEWVTAADTERKLKNTLNAYARDMIAAEGFALGIVAVSIAFRLDIASFAFVFATLWALSPLVAYALSLPAQKPRLDNAARIQLRSIARRTWAFFEDYQNESNGFLMIDNMQEQPKRRIANRTSPTNIGMAMLSTICAYELGFITLAQAAVRIERAMDTIDRLEKWNGHLYNWYDTSTLKPLRPMFVSSVDSGNLAVCMLTCAQALVSGLNDPVISRKKAQGLMDALELARKRETTAEARDAANRLLRMFSDEAAPTPAQWVVQLKRIADLAGDDAKRAADTARALLDEAALLEGFEDADRVSIARVANGEGETGGKAREFIQGVRNLAQRLEDFALGMDNLALYDPARSLFSVGYDCQSERLSNSHYDLLATEARLTSYLAIVKGEVEPKHWQRMGRPLTMAGDRHMLVSWGGTMFEYLMPLIFLKNYEGTLLDETYKSSVIAQRRYGEKLGIPWGVSESAYYAFDMHLNYQYKAFGVPKTGLKPASAGDMVVAPYAGMLALMVDPIAAYANIRQLKKEGLLGEYGFYEAVDYTPARMPEKKRRMIVRCFMAHHQGMALAAITNCLCGDAIQKHFHSLPRIRAGELLLQERAPDKSIIIREYQVSQAPVRVERGYVRTINYQPGSFPEANLLSNGRYNVMVTAAGTGYSMCDGTLINRWRSDAAHDNWGIFHIIRDPAGGRTWSAAHTPLGGACRTVFEPHRAAFERREGDFTTQYDICVSPEENAELRTVRITNHSAADAELEITQFFELCLTGPGQDEAHRAFNQLFTETSFDSGILLARRRSGMYIDEAAVATAAVIDGEIVKDVSFETESLRVFGRNAELRDARAINSMHGSFEGTGAPIDASLCLRARLRVPAKSSAEACFIIAFGGSKSEAQRAVTALAKPGSAERALEMAWTCSKMELSYLGINGRQAQRYLALASHALYLSPTRRKHAAIIGENRLGQPGLWSFGISGDLPIVLVKASSMAHLDMARDFIRCHEYWRMRGLVCDLVILNEHGGDYFRPLHDKLIEEVSRRPCSRLNERGGVFVLSAENMKQEEITLIHAAAIAIFGDKPYEDKRPPRGERKIKKAEYPRVSPPPPRLLEFDNSFGGFANGEYVINMDAGRPLPMPWSNVIANEKFGTLVTEAGGGYTWDGNSRERRLTPWSNDPVRDPSFETVFIRDEETSQYWTLTSPENTPRTVRHGRGYTVFEMAGYGLEQSLCVFADEKLPVKVFRLKLKNPFDTQRKLSATLYAELILGSKMAHAQYIVTEFDGETGALFAKNVYTDVHAYIAAPGSAIAGYTGDRREFWGYGGRFPEAMRRDCLMGTVGAGLDPCGAIAVDITLEPHSQREIVFLLGSGDREDAEKAIAAYANGAGGGYLAAVGRWDGILNAIRVETPDKAFNLLINDWLLYQVFASRLYARTGFYQSGGAFGFRDQLQDCLAAIYSRPNYAREHILLCAAHQFTEGDVQHWWHPPRNGVRTRITDDLLFLPYVACIYAKETGDYGIFAEKAPYLSAPELGEDEETRYFAPDVTDFAETLYEHCMRAFRRVNLSPRGLPLMGAGDWNDGMDRVGGESVWLGFFAYAAIREFLPVCQKFGAPGDRSWLSAFAESIREAVNEAWDGEWYKRAYFCDGTPLGSRENPECGIDLVSQVWAVLSGAVPESRAMLALESAKGLIDRENGVVRLLWPPFDRWKDPGYIRGYLPGARENGGQYTHAAAWLVLALAKLGSGNEAYRVFSMINPINKTRTEAEVMRYKTEPYAVPGDVYSMRQHAGRGGWTWYTGSAAWMYRAALSGILGINRQGSSLIIEPCIPSHWPGYTVEYTVSGCRFKITVENPEGLERGHVRLWLDGRETGSIELKEGEHTIRAVIGRKVDNA